MALEKCRTFLVAKKTDRIKLEATKLPKTLQQPQDIGDEDPGRLSDLDARVVY